MSHVPKSTALSIIALTIALTGCLGPRRETYETSRVIRVRDTSDATGQLWTAVKDVLREHRFRLDRVNVRTGVVTTMPVASQHFFEFWRHDVDTTPDFWEATLNAMRRWVEVSVTPARDDAASRIEVVVHKERFSAPDRQFNASGAAYQVFGYRLPSATGDERITPEDERWVAAGRDPALEAYLLRAILERAGLLDSEDLRGSVRDNAERAAFAPDVPAL